MISEKFVFKRIETLLGGLNLDAPLERLAVDLAPRLLEAFADATGIATVQIYGLRRRRMTLIRSFGAPAGDLSGSILRRMLAVEGGANLPWAGPTEAGLTGVFPLDEKRSVLAALLFSPGSGPAEARPAEVESVVSTFHTALVSQIDRHQMRDTLAEAHAIQMSLLPPGRIQFGNYDIAAASRPARSVGGDLYELFRLGEDGLALGVADSSGHGLPAALLARDVATALRMSVELELKLTRVTEKLNRVIHRSGLTTRFISLFVGELETNGNLFYVNAGHPPALLLDDRGLRELSVGGMILGPNPNARYKLGFAHVDRGAALVVVSDGVLERLASNGEEFGVERLTTWLREWRDGDAASAVANLLDRLAAFGDGAPFEDDVTALLVRRPA